MDYYMAVCEVEWYSEFDNRSITEYIGITNIDNYASAMNLVEAYYGDDIESVKITLLEGPFIHLNKDMADRIINGEDFSKEGEIID